MSVYSLRIAAPLALLLACVSGTAVAATSGPATSATASALIPVKDFARHPLIMAPRLSPDGTYLAVRVDSPSGDEHGLAIYRLSDMQVVSLLNMPKYQVPLNMTWVSPTWLVVEKGKEFGSLDAPMSTGEIIATDVTGKQQRYIYGHKQVGRRAATRQNDYGTGSIVGMPEKANGHFYMGAQPWDEDNLSRVYNIGVEDNSRHLIADMHVYGMDFLIDPQGNAQYAFGANADFDYVVYKRQGSGWTPLDPRKVGSRFAPFAYAPDHQHIYAMWSKDGGPNELVEEDLDDSHRKILAQNTFSSIGDLEWTAPPQQPFAAVPDAGFPQPIFINPNLPAARLYRGLQKSFPNEFVDFLDFSEDGSKLLFEVSSDRDPGSYYLLDTQTHKARKLFVEEPWIKPANMATRWPFQFKASDGMTLEGILTFPPKRAQNNLPMVLVPHGGPHGPSDDWFYDADAQFLASRGYLVLQVNYRGSGGRGASFEQAGYLKWGTRIQQDLIDGVKWTIAQHFADPKRICVYGGSFGGYSAMMTVIRAPHMFKCAIGYSGIYDLKMMYEKGDIRSSRSGRSYLTTVIGKNDADLDANSPDKLADKIDVPVFLAHGKADRRAPFAQAKAMRAALDAAHKPYEWMAVPKEGHGFFTEKDRAAFLTKMQAFLEKYIGKGAPVQQ